jgi:signal transduction histidine kinase
LSVYLDNEVARQKKAERDERVNTVWFPMFRAVGFALLLAAVYLHQRAMPEAHGGLTFAHLAAVYVAYCVTSWVLLRGLYRKLPILGPVFLTVDVVAWTLAVYASGGDHSWLFLLFIMRPADQTAAGLRRVLWFAFVSVACYAGLLAWLSLADHRIIDWPTAGAKLTFIALANLYMLVPTQAAERLRRRNVEAVRVARRLIQELEDRTGQLEAALDRGDQAARARTDFLRNVTHELRTPLNGIIGTTALALQDDLTRDQRELLEVARQSGENLLRLVTDLLDMSSIESSGVLLQPAPMSLRALVASVLQACGPQAEAKRLMIGATVPPDIPDALTGDAVRVRQVLLHLVENAVKFTARGRVGIVVSVEERSAASVLLRFEVQDTGIGIAPEAQKRIFEPFTQADPSTSRVYQGCGLGLTIASRLVHLMDGRLWVESQVGSGSAFIFTLRFSLQEVTEMRRA